MSEVKTPIAKCPYFETIYPAEIIGKYPKKPIWTLFHSNKEQLRSEITELEDIVLIANYLPNCENNIDLITAKERSDEEIRNLIDSDNVKEFMIEVQADFERMVQGNSVVFPANGLN